ncbi:hypothetical protein DL98DRAFT_655504 [Cadophora sp. DSE1049]|nr:hypothetical protein DL98DRAFT_655504 [Cadophora sp. DSE1049]
MSSPATYETISTVVEGVLGGSNTTRQEATLGIQWELPEYLANQYDDQDVGRILRVSGFAKNAEATTCAVYMGKHWPTSGNETLMTVQKAISRLAENNAEELVKIGPGLEVLLRPKANPKPLISLFRIKGTGNYVVEVMQQLAWLATSFRESNLKTVAYSGFSFQAIIRHQFQIDINPLEPLAPEDQCCWQPLFHNAVIAKGFPISKRDGEQGLEIELDVMQALGGAMYPVRVDGRTILSGFHTLFIATQFIKKDGKRNSAEWHFIYNTDGTRIELDSTLWELYKGNAVGTDYSQLCDARTFLGFYNIAELCLGTEDANYPKISYSNARLTRQHLELSSVTGGQYVTATIARGRNENTNDFGMKATWEEILGYTEHLPVILFNTDDKRGWMVPALSVLLHMAQLYTRSDPRLITYKGQKRCIPYAQRSTVLELAAREIIENYDKAILRETTVFDPSKSEPPTHRDYYLYELIMFLWARLNSVIGRSKIIESQTGVLPLKQDTLDGWEMMDIASSQSTINLKTVPIGKTSGGWTLLSGRKIQIIDYVRGRREHPAAVVSLFCKGLGDVIKPAESGQNRLCAKYGGGVPHDRYYLQLVSQVFSSSLIPSRVTKFSLHGEFSSISQTGIFLPIAIKKLEIQGAVAGDFNSLSQAPPYLSDPQMPGKLKALLSLAWRMLLLRLG